jgi:hypothetical protein
MKLDFFDRIKKNSNIKFHENPSTWIHDEAFRNFANCPYFAEKLQEFGLY